VRQTELPLGSDGEDASWSAYCDGASRGNPGPASFGIVILDPLNRPVKEIKKRIGTDTNQVAEYEALICALQEMFALGAPAARVFTDSQFVTKQFTGEYKVRDPRMKVLRERVREWETKFDSVTVTHIARSSHPMNKRADELANEALDELR
jgi:ribonuclease HI